MAFPSIDYAALATLNLWLMTDSSVHIALQKDSRSDKLNAIERGAHRFGFSRQLNSKYDSDIGLVRFQPALDVIDSLKIQSFEENLVDSIKQVAHRISSHYGNTNVIPATTQLLWLKFRHPIIIYDERIASALGTRLTHDYYDQWQARYKFHKQSVLDACSSLVNSLTYVFDPAIATEDYVMKLATTTWFQHRVFGTYLTHMGRSTN